MCVEGIFSLHHCVQAGCESHPVMDTWGFFSGGKAAGHEAHLHLVLKLRRMLGAILHASIYIYGIVHS